MASNSLVVSCRRRRRLSCFSLHLVLLVLLSGCLFALIPTALGIEAQWTPSDESEGGPLPLSSQQRQQLMQLDEAIRSSPDPENTLQQVAESNQMQPDELASLLARNRRDMQAAGGAFPTHSKPTNVVWNILATLGAVVARTASKNPRAFLLAVTALVCLIFIAATAPRTGLVLSTHRSIISKGPTTFFSPPMGYIQRRLQDKSILRGSLSVRSEDHLTEKLSSLLPELGDETTWQKVRKSKSKSNLQYVASSQSRIDAYDFVSPSTEGDEDESTDEELNEVMDFLLEHASTLLGSRELTEFVEPTSSIRLVTDSTSRKRSILVVSGMGDWGRYGQQPLRVTQEDSSDKDEETMSLTFSTLKGGHWDGQLQVTVERRNTNIVIRTSILFPRGGRRIGRSVALRIAECLSQSIERSLRTRTKQSLARRSQSSRFQGKARSRAKQRRDMRFVKEKAIEEMAADRRRRWQRQNPNAGHYRPSGERMRSPHNAVY